MSETKEYSVEYVQRLETALTWIMTVNRSIDLNKLDQKTLIGLIWELRGKAKSVIAVS